MVQTKGAPTRVLHVEVGGSYGGSLRALELYLRYSDRTRFTHEALFYYPTPGMESLEGLVDEMGILYDSVPPDWNSLRVNRPFSQWAAWKTTAMGRKLADLRDWICLILRSEAARRIADVLLRGRYEVVHVNNTFTYQAPTILAAKRIKIPLIAHIRNPVRDSIFARRLSRSIDAVVAVNTSLEQELRSWCLATRIYMCHDGAAMPTVNRAAAERLRASLLRGGRILIGSVGRLEAQKGFQNLIQAARIVVDKESEVRFAIAGEGPLRASLEAAIANLRLNDHVQLCGFRSDVSDFLGALDLFVCSSEWEGGPLVVIEAMSLGIPVVSTAVGFTPNIIDPGETGELLSTNKPDLLALAILEAIDRSRHGLYKSAKAVQTAREWANPYANARIMDDLISNLIK